MVQKAQLQGSGDGTAVPAGYVGEIKQAGVAAFTNSAGSGTITDVATITLTPGVWSVSALFGLRFNAATFSTLDTWVMIATAAAPATTGFRNGISYNEILSTNLTSSTNRFTLPISSFTLRYDGTNFYYADGTSVASASGILYLKSQIGTYSAGTPQYVGSIHAVRIA